MITFGFSSHAQLLPLLRNLVQSQRWVIFSVVLVSLFCIPVNYPIFSFVFNLCLFPYFYSKSYFQKGTKLGISSLLPGWGVLVVNIVL